MEKKTIGKFIAALRHANGYTQKQLADMLYVSDKTVSRWERDECSPDLSLIPAIAEIFNITTDELLRGERKSSTASESNSPDNTSDTSNDQKKTERQLTRLTDKKLRTYNTLSLISVGITAVGLIIASVADLAFSKGMIAFAIALTSSVISEICQLCFAVNANLSQSVLLDLPCDNISADHNRKVRQTLLRISLINAESVVFCLPLVTLIDGANYGLTFPSWMLYGLIFGALFYAVLHVFYVFLLKKCVFLRDFSPYSNTNMETFDVKKRVLAHCLTAFLTVLAIIIVCISVLNSAGPSIFMSNKMVVFNDLNDFKAYVENDFDEWFKLACAEIEDENDIKYLEIHSKTQEVLRDDSGSILCEYYYNPSLYHEIYFSSSNDGLPINILTQDDFMITWDLIKDIEGLLYTAIYIDFCVCAAIYITKCVGLTKKAKSHK